MLKIKNLHARAGGAEILKGISLTVRPGEVHAIMGPNGSGKSTVANVLAGRPSVEVTEGSISYEGEDLLALARNEAVRMGGNVVSPLSGIQAGEQDFAIYRCP